MVNFNITGKIWWPLKSAFFKSMAGYMSPIYLYMSCNFDRVFKLMAWPQITKLKASLNFSTIKYTCTLFGFRGRKVFEPPRYMTVGQAAVQITQALANRERDGDPLKCKVIYTYV